MARKQFDPQELVRIGQYPASFGGRPGAAKYARVIEPRENARLYFEGKKPYWIPMWGMDVQGFRPRMHPDNVATHLIVDAEEPYVYEGDTMKGWFDLDWVFVPHVGGATVKPGNPLVEDITKWKEVTAIPDLDKLDWEGAAEKNKEYLNTDLFKEVCTLSGLWERLISLMDVEGAAVAFIDEEQQEGVHSFFTELCDMYDDMIARYAKYFDLDILLMHDDWGTQRAPFFSLATCREMLVPYLKRIVDACHKNGLRFELHSCGFNEALVPAMIEAGVDIWCGQPMNDYVKLSEMYPDTCLSFGLYLPEITDDMTDEDIRNTAKELVDTYKDRRVVFNTRGANEKLVDYLYEESRNYYVQFND